MATAIGVRAGPDVAGEGKATRRILSADRNGDSLAGEGPGPARSAFGESPVGTAPSPVMLSRGLCVEKTRELVREDEAFRSQGVVTRPGGRTGPGDLQIGPRASHGPVTPRAVPAECATLPGPLRTRSSDPRRHRRDWARNGRYPHAPLRVRRESGRRPEAFPLHHCADAASASLSSIERTHALAGNRSPDSMAGWVKRGSSISLWPLRRNRQTEVDQDIAMESGRRLIGRRGRDGRPTPASGSSPFTWMTGAVASTFAIVGAASAPCAPFGRGWCGSRAGCLGRSVGCASDGE